MLQPIERNPADDVERQYLEHRRTVLAMLRVEFPRLREPEELYQEAWTELLELQARTHEPVRDTRALLKKIAWRRARDSYRRIEPEATDPHSDVLALVEDKAAQPDHEVAVRTEAATLRLAIEALEPREAAVLKLRFDHGLTAKEIQAELDVSANRLEKLMTSAYSRVLAAMSPEADGETPLRQRQRSLLLACEVGIASSRQRARAQRMVRVDPACSAMLREMRQTLGDVAAVLPMPVLVEADRHHGRRFEVVFGWFDNLRAGAGRVAERLPGGSHATEAAASGASAAGGGVAVKAVLVCLAAGGTAAVCGVSLRDSSTPAPRSAPPRANKVAATPTRVHTDTTPTVTATPPSRVPAPKERKIVHVKKRVAETPVSSPKSEPSVSPAPVGSTEFGPGAVGNSAAPTRPAVAPTNGGGEFGP